MRKIVLVTAVPLIAAIALGAAVTVALSGTESTSTLDRYTTETIDGHKALAPNIVAGRTESKYHPLPWIGTDISMPTCPGPLAAVAGTTMTCTAKADDRPVQIRITVVKVDGDRLTWKFER